MSLDKVKGFWDANPCGGEAEYRSRFQWIKKTEPWAFELMSPLIRNKECLEVGCGQGFLANYLGPQTKHLTAVDISDKSIEIAQEGRKILGVHNVSFQYGNAEDLPFADNRFDLVYSIGVLHHTPNTQKGIDELYRVLKPNGTCVVMLYKKHNPKWLAVKIARAFSKIIDCIAGREFLIANYLRDNQKHPDHGTALLELFGCPILKMYSKGQAKRMFQRFAFYEIQLFSSGFIRLFDFLPSIFKKSSIQMTLRYLDSWSNRFFGFYMVITAIK